MPSGKSATVDEGTLISDAAHGAGVVIEMPCGGKGKCGRCTVSTDPDGRKSVLACQTAIYGDTTVTVPQKEGAVSASSDHRALDIKNRSPVVSYPEGYNYGLAVDIGTTTVAVSIVDMNSGLDVYSSAGENAQRVRGEDVLTRMQYAEDGGTEELRRLVLGSVNDLIDICLDRRCDPNSIRAAYISGNTTMMHLFMGVDPSSMRTGRDPVFKEAEVTGKESGLNINPDARVLLMPSVSAYVGGDVTSGVVASGMDIAPRTSVLIDVGTNGEVALGDRDIMVVCSSSAGPAFEGGGVTSGMPARIGAIDSVRISDGRLEYTTIMSAKPKGICGSGLIDLLAELFRNGWVDKRGTFTETAPVEDGGDGKFLTVADNVIVTQEDIRTMILTKAAIYAAAESLVRSVGDDLREMDRIYIAGGFGSFIDLENAITIGLFPDVPRERYVHLMNASLEGAKHALISSSFRKRIGKVSKRMTYLDLSADPRFSEEYISALFLPHTELSRFPSVNR